MSDEKWVSPYEGKAKFYYGSSSNNPYVNDLFHKMNIEQERKARDPSRTVKNLKWFEQQQMKSRITAREVSVARAQKAGRLFRNEVKTERSETDALSRKIRRSRKVKQIIQNNFGEEFNELNKQLSEAVEARKASNAKLAALLSLAKEVRVEREASEKSR
eukprot:g8818.t1